MGGIVTNVTKYYLPPPKKYHFVFLCYTAEKEEKPLISVANVAYFSYIANDMKIMKEM